MTIRHFCLSCGNSRSITLARAEHDFGRRPEGATEASSDMCHRCYPNHGIYPCGWVKPTTPTQEGSTHG